jgi:hypothetical protein
VGLSCRCFPLVIVPIEGLDLFVWGAIGGSLWVIGLNKGTLVASGGETGKLGNWEMVLIGWLATLFFLIIRHVHHLFWLAQHQQLKRLWYELKVVFFFVLLASVLKYLTAVLLEILP